MRPSRAAVALAVAVGLSTLLRFWGGTLVPTPWIAPDEVIYGELGRSLWSSGRFELLGRPAEFLSLVYPALVGPALELADLERGYRWLKLLQALVMSLTAVPVYAWARSLASKGLALAAAALTLAVPGLAYSGLLMTEVAFYPTLLLAAWALALALVRPTPPRQALLVGATALAAMTRLQAFVLVPAFFTALGLDAVLRRRVRPALRLWPAAAGLLALAGGWAAWRLRDGGPLSRVFGGYEPAGQVHYGLGRALRFAVYHLADLALFTGLVPLLALVLLVSVRERDDALRAYLAAAVSLCLWLPLEVGVFASQHVGLVAERNLLPLAPVLFVGLAAWLARGASRPPVLTAAAAAGIVALLVALPVRKLVTSYAFPDAFTLLPVIRAAERGRDVDVLVPAVAAVCLAVAALLPRRLTPLLPAALLLAFASLSVSATREIEFRAGYVESISTGPSHRWVDDRARGPVAYLFIGEQNWPTVWENVFWNRRIDRVYDLLTARIPGGLPQDSVGPLEDGRLVDVGGRPAHAEYVVAQYPVAFAGRPVANGVDGQVLWKLHQPVRLSVWTQRASGHQRVLVYACRGGRLRVGLTGAAGDTVELRRDDGPYRRFRLPASGAWSGSIPARPRRPLGTRLCTFDVVAPPTTQVPVLAFARAR